MTDYGGLVERLRLYANEFICTDILLEAANEIERLQSVADAEMKQREGNFDLIETLERELAAMREALTRAAENLHR